MTKLAPIIVTALLVLSWSTTATAFCGFYVSGGDAKLFNEATQVVLMRGGNKTALSMQNNYEGPLEDFALVVPVPQILQKENVKTLPKDTFDRLDRLSAPRLVEYWEQDPCAPSLGDIGQFASLGLRGSGRGGGGLGARSGGFVRVEAQFEVGEYDIVILKTNQGTALEEWLNEHSYKIPQGAAPYFRPYIEGGMYFFVARVDPKKVKFEDGRAVLSPLRFHYESDAFSLPIRLGMINSKGAQDLIVYILAKQQRYEVANYANVAIPTNIEVSPRVREQFGEFYEALFSRTVEENPKAVVTEYAWQASKCDPCPPGLMSGQALSMKDATLLGDDVLRIADRGWGGSGLVLTRLHARYSPDDIGEDLVFQKAPPLMGGREVREADGTLESGSKQGDANNFQGRYIMRHEWEGTVACEEPNRGMWGGPPNPHQMELVADTVVAELRRQKADAEGRDLSPSDLEAPRTPEEEKAVGFHLRRKFGTSHQPASAGYGGAPAVAPSANTRGVSIGISAGVQLAALVAQPVPELKLEPAPALEEPPAPNGDSASGEAATPDPAAPAETPAREQAPADCSTVGAASPLHGLLWAMLLFFGARRRH